MRLKSKIIGAWICLLVILLFLLVVILSPAEAAYVTTARQDELHAQADALRALGYAEDSEAIQALSSAWWQEEDALNIIAKVIANEAPGTPDAQWCPV